VGQRQDLIAMLSYLPLCATPFAHWIATGELRAQLREKGFSISTPDAHIAQCALDIDATLLSSDNIFKKICTHINLSLSN